MDLYSLKEGTVLKNRYQVIRVLGTGGFGITYLVRDWSLEQFLVIKEYFPRELAGRAEGNVSLFIKEKKDSNRFQKGKQAFLLEARRLSGLFDVPEVVKVLDWFQENDTAYLVMEYVKGIELSAWLERREAPLSFQEAWRMMEPAAAALKRVHEKGLIHRDLNPSNLMVLEEGQIRILDFGASRRYLDNEKTMTILVKRGYAPPEQYTKKEKQGPWTDVYSFCATLYEMITGVRPEPSIERMQKDELYLPSAYGGEITPEEEQILCRGLELDPKKRIRNMGELIRALQPEEKETTGTHKGGSLRAKRWVAAAGTGVLAGLGVILGGLFLFAKGESRPETVTYAGNYGRNTSEYKEYLEFVRENARETRQLEPINEESGERLLYTITPQAVQEWGEPCNMFRFFYSGEDFISWLEAEGYLPEKTGEKETDTVEVWKYGAVLTRFIAEEEYDLGEGVTVCVSCDSVNQDLLELSLYREESGSREALEKAALALTGFLTQELETDREKESEEFHALLWEEADVPETRYNYYLRMTEEEKLVFRPAYSYLFLNCYWP